MGRDEWSRGRYIAHQVLGDNNMNLVDHITKDGGTLESIAAYLDGLNDDERVLEARRLTPAAQRSLWSLTADTQLTLENFVPEQASALASVRHFGRNTLPLFKMFEKRFCRPPKDSDSKGLWGYNEGSTRAAVGPGYFVCRYTDGDPRGSVVIDYTLTPGGKSADWPDISSNKKGLSRFVYFGMQDFMRQVSDHVTIGRAYVKGKETNNFFVLCRES